MMLAALCTRNRYAVAGQTLVEYALVLALVSVGVVGAVNAFGGRVSTSVTKMKTDVATQSEPTTITYVAPSTMSASSAGTSYVGAEAGQASGASNNNECENGYDQYGLPC